LRHKQIISSNNFNGFHINNGKNNEYECYGDILNSIYDIFDFMTSKYSKVLLIRFDLSYPETFNIHDHNKHITHLFKMIMDNSRNKGIGLQYLWVREQSKSKHQHYHCMVLVNGHKTQKYYPFLKLVEDKWAYVLGVQEKDGLVHFCNNNGLMIRKPYKNSVGSERICQQENYEKDLHDAFYWCSYLAKVNQKTNKLPPYVRRFNSSLRR
jgi:plasmid rolling circle replication initiator protein Rep